MPRTTEMPPRDNVLPFAPARRGGAGRGTTSAARMPEGAAADLLVPALPGAAAFFDLDNTLLRGASMFYLAKVLAARKVVSKQDIVRFGWQQACFRLRGLENPKHVANARGCALAFIAGRQVSELASIAEEVIDLHLEPRLWQGVRELAEAYRDCGHPVWLVTASPVELAGAIAHRLGLTGALGTIPEAVDGVYTGRLRGDFLHGPAKATAIREIALRDALDLQMCAAYSDSANDIPMLSSVGFPCAVNPDTKLLRHAKENGWAVREFRTTRRAFRFALPAAGVGAVCGGTVAAVAVRRRTQTHSS